MAKITVQNTQITVIKQNEDDYISLTDMLKAKDGEFFFSNWLRNRNTIEFLGIWERLMNPNFNCAEFDIIKSQAGLNRFRLSAKEWTEKIYNGLHGLYGFLVARGDDGRMQNNPNGRSRRGSKIRIIRAIRCGKTLPKLK